MLRKRLYKYSLLTVVSVVLASHLNTTLMNQAMAAGPAAKANEKANEKASEQAKELDWSDLVPADWQPEKLFQGISLEGIEDDDPRAKVYLEKMQKIWAEAPVVTKLDGKLVKIPGYVVPLEDDGTKVTEFLLVPYHGACIHEPPPPANQTVYVKTGTAEAKIRKMFDTVWVTGIMQLEKIDRELATSGYTINAIKVEPFE
ncbi:MAG: DUF3299 domain-containing protein [Gammaproteobacteria bacterium]|nr:DUF3299 domain-containing protein [Gammaproteobacteria bacterium]